MILNIPGRGFGPGASVAFVVTRGYSIGEAVVSDELPDRIWYTSPHATTWTAPADHGHEWIVSPHNTTWR